MPSLRTYSRPSKIKHVVHYIWHKDRIWTGKRDLYQKRLLKLVETKKREHCTLHNMAALSRRAALHHNVNQVTPHPGLQRR